MNRPTAALTLMLMLSTCSALFAQARNAPAGNSLPEAEAPAPQTTSDAIPSDTTPIMSSERHAAFADRVDLSDIRKAPVFDNGRVKIIDTLARERLTRIYGKSRWKDPVTDRKYDPVFTYLDLLFNKAFYADKPMVYVEVLPLRRRMVELLPASEQEKWLKLGRLAPLMFLSTQMQTILDESASDLLLAKARGQVLGSWFALQKSVDEVQLISPEPGGDHWMTIPEYSKRGTSGKALESLVADLETAWKKGDAATVNQLMSQLCEQLTTLNAETYPAGWRMKLEYFYNATKKFTIGYVGYFLATICLLIAFGVKRKWLTRAGVIMLFVGFTIHTAGFATRGVLSGRWPIHNQYESFIALSWFAALVGIILMCVKKQLLYGAAAAALGTCALVIANTVDIPSNEMGQVAGILGTSRILYVHVNMVIASYSLIALAFFVSLFYLALYYFRNRSTTEYAAAGLSEDGTTAETTGPQSTLRDLDRAQMIVLQLAFWLLGVGILLGAYWADHAWGRWWAWDPKETWALITWIIYLMVIHIRFAAKKPHLVTAWLSVIGFFMMLWTHWGVNLLLAGLHSYA